MSKNLPPWNELIAGKGCPFCQPREESNIFHEKICALDVSTLYLVRNQTYRGYCVLIFNPRHVTGIEHLRDDEFTRFSSDLRRAAHAIHAVTQPDMMNYATLGNVIPHLHYHLIPRYQADPRWGAPIWESDLSTMEVTTLNAAAFNTLRDDLKRTLQDKKY